MNKLKFRFTCFSSCCVTPVLLAFLVLAGVQTVQAAIIRVNVNAVGGDGTSWGSAYQSLTLALAAANSGDELWVAKGVYTPLNIGRTATFQLKSGVAIYGGFAGTETLRTQRNFNTQITVLSGDLTKDDVKDVHGVTSTINGTNAIHVVLAANVINSIIDGVTVSGGNANSIDSYNGDNSGGGINTNDSDITLNNIIFSGNQGIKGGGMYSGRSKITLNNAYFTSNNSDDEYSGGIGGGMCIGGSIVTLNNVIFSENKAGSLGGGMCTDYQVQEENIIKMNNVTFKNNQAWSCGGARITEVGKYSIINSRFNDNYGGGLCSGGESDLVMENVTFSGNNAPNSQGGGLYFNWYSTATLTDVTFNNNQSAQEGGGMYSDHEVDVTLTRVTFTNNQALRGGGMCSFASSNSGPLGNILLRNVTFNGNQATDAGGGLYSGGENSSLTNVIFSNNKAKTNGGGMYSNYSFENNAKLNFVIFDGNYSQEFGGGMYTGEHIGNTELTNVSFRGNKADISGGGMYNNQVYIINNEQASTTLTNIIFSNNHATISGGGLFTYRNDLTMKNITFSGNKSLSGGGIFNDESVPTLTNCILWGDSATNGPEIFNNSNDPAIISFSNVQGGYPGTGNSDRNPLFVNPVSATLAPTVAGDYHLRTGSPAIDAGDNNAVTIAVDRDGKPRLEDGDGNGTARVDLGAYEYRGTSIPSRGSITLPWLMLLLDQQ